MDTEEYIGHEGNENKKSDTESVPKPDEIINNEIKTKSSDTTMTDTAPLLNNNVTNSDDITKTNVTQELTGTHDPTVTHEEKKQVLQKEKTEFGNKKQKPKNQPKLKKISELKMMAKARRRIATVERRQAQKDFHYMSKQMEKSNVKIEAECKAIQDELLTQ